MPSLILHIVKKDFRTLRLYLGIWWGILSGSALATVWQIHWILSGGFGDNFQKLEDGLERWFWFFVVMDVVLLVLVVDAILKNDSPLEEKAFWHTRAIGKGRMYAAKLASIALFCFVVPGFIQAVQHLVFGFSVGEFSHWLEQFAFIQGTLVAAVACVAVLYKRIVEGLIHLAGFFFAWVFANEIFATVDASRRHVFEPLYGALLVGWSYYGWMLFATVLVVAALMYAGQSPRAGKLALLCGFLLNWAAGLFLPPKYDVLQVYPYDDWVYQNPARNDAVKLSVEPSSFTDRDTFSPLWRIYGWINNPSFPELHDSVWRIASFSSELSWPRSTTIITSLNSYRWSPQAAQLINAPAAIAAAGYGRLAWPIVGTWRNFPIAALNTQPFTRIKTEAAKITEKIYIESGRLERIADVPAAEGSRWREGMTTLRVRSINLPGPTTAELKIDKIGPRRLQLDPSFGGPDPVFLLYNSQTKECAEGVSNTADPANGPSLSRAGFSWEQQPLTFTFANKTDANGQRVSDFADTAALAHWLADARLVELGFVHDQYFYIPVTIDQFLLPVKAPANAVLIQN